MYDENSPLDSLYPLLTGTRPVKTPDPGWLLETVYHKAAHGLAVKRDFFETNAQRIVDMAVAVADVYRAGARLLAMGHGAACCDAEQFAVQFMQPAIAGRPSLAVINLAAGTAQMSAAADAAGYDQVFVRQLIGHARPGDGLIGFSHDGSSPALLRSFRRAKQLGLITLALCGGADGGGLAASRDIDYCLAVITESTHRVQETQVAVCHILGDLVHSLLAADRGDL